MRYEQYYVLYEKVGTISSFISGNRFNALDGGQYDHLGNFDAVDEVINTIINDIVYELGNMYKISGCFYRRYNHCRVVLTKHNEVSTIYFLIDDESIMFYRSIGDSQRSVGWLGYDESFIKDCLYGE